MSSETMPLMTPANTSFARRLKIPRRFHRRAPGVALELESSIVTNCPYVGDNSFEFDAVNALEDELISNAPRCGSFATDVVLPPRYVSVL